MNTKSIFFVLYTWFSAALTAIILFWFSSIDNLYYQDFSKLLERLTFFLGFGFLTILIYRALISTFRLNVERLSFSKTKREEYEDREFEVIVLTLLLTIAILISTIIAISSVLYLNKFTARDGSLYLLLVDLLGILIFAFFTYSWPVLGSIEARLFKVERE